LDGCDIFDRQYFFYVQSQLKITSPPHLVEIFIKLSSLGKVFNFKFEVGAFKKDKASSNFSRKKSHRLLKYKFSFKKLRVKLIDLKVYWKNYNRFQQSAHHRNCNSHLKSTRSILSIVWVDIFITKTFPRQDSRHKSAESERNT